MSTSPAAAVQLIDGILVDTSVAFVDKKGNPKKGFEKRQRELLGKLSSYLPRFLEPEEKVLLVTTACSPMTFWEQYTSGWMIYYIKRALLVFTDRRMIHVPTTTNYGWRDSIAQVRWGDCEKIKLGWGRFELKYRTGKTERFYYVHGKERAQLKALIPRLSSVAPVAAPVGRRHLCPRCGHALEAGLVRCPGCQLEFKNKKEALRLSLLFPGGGYFYTRHTGLGVLDVLAEGWIIILLLVSVSSMIRGEAGAEFAVALFAVALFFEKLFTVYHSNHYLSEFIPRDKKVDPLMAR
ncbi:MAG: hypothetical protein ABIJ09_10960 [Pseudomonadota bacterium]